MKSSRGLEILTPADGIARLLNEPLEKIERMIAAGTCPTPFWREGMSQPRWRDSDIPAWIRLLRGDRLSPDSGLEPIGSILGRVMGTLEEMPKRQPERERPGRVAAQSRPSSKETSDTNNTSQVELSETNSIGTHDDWTGCDLVSVCEISALLNVPLLEVWTWAGHVKGFPPYRRDASGCRQWRLPEVVEWLEGVRNG